jgi:hypothetical protein
MAKMRSLIIGMGEIGAAVGELLVKKDEVYSYDMLDGELEPLNGVDIVHICFPYSDTFVDDVKSYIKDFKPFHVIIWATVPIGTTKQIRGAVHSPVEGRHPALALSVRSMTRWVGANDKGEGEFFAQYFKDLYLKTRVVDSSDFTEFLKLRSTAKFGINLVWTEYEASVAEDLGMDFKLVMSFDEDYNKLYHNLSMPWAQRYILRPPNGKIGGHCIVPNAELLDEQYPSELLKMIKEMK